MSFMPVYLGLNGMSIEVTEFYYNHLLQSNICNRLISLCVSDRLAIDNGLWLSSHLSRFINLRHLSLFDIKRSYFELILNSLSPINSLKMFSIHFSTNDRATDTFIGVPEGAYYERIFHLFPLLRVCHLFFHRYILYTVDSQFVLPADRPFMLIKSSLSNLQSLAVRCSPRYLSYLFDYLPQLEELRYKRTDPWLPETHPQRHDDNNRAIPINKHQASNLRRLKLNWNGRINTVDSINKLFERDVLFSLTNLKLWARMAGSHVLHHLLSMLSSQCLYSFDVKWFVESVVSLSDTSNILSDTFQQLKGPVSIELQLTLEENYYYVRAVTVPRMDKHICVYSYLDNAVHSGSRWPYKRRIFNSQFLRCNEIIMSENDDKVNGEFLCLSPSIVFWNKITSVNIPLPLNSTYLHFLFSQTTNLRTLELHYKSYGPANFVFEDETLIDFLTDVCLCNMLVSHGLRQLNIFTAWKQPNLINIAYLIVERLPHLQVIELRGIDDELIEMSHILINGLKKLNYFTFRGLLGHGKRHEKEFRNLENSNTRYFRTEVPNTIDADIFIVWL
ncbi:unnamed protein product [Rotaria sordida]|uniref:Uncharacterized protein n=1 Tax=Rotaria sordida TaxID=392033 RepID=A0A819UHY4_9BILA|nr:unnamed protein product [Rotaria sordida]